MSSSSSALQVAVQEGCHSIAMTNAYLFVGLCTRLLCTYFYHYVSSDVRDWTKKIESAQKNCSVSETGQFFFGRAKKWEIDRSKRLTKSTWTTLIYCEFLYFLQSAVPTNSKDWGEPPKDVDWCQQPAMQLSMRPWYEKMGEQEMKNHETLLCMCMWTTPRT